MQTLKMFSTTIRTLVFDVKNNIDLNPNNSQHILIALLACSSHSEFKQNSKTRE